MLLNKAVQSRFKPQMPDSITELRTESGYERQQNTLLDLFAHKFLLPSVLPCDLRMFLLGPVG